MASTSKRPVVLLSLIVLGGVAWWAGRSVRASGPKADVMVASESDVVKGSASEPKLPVRRPPGTPKGVAPASEFHPRDPYEWQGMLVNLTMRQLACADSAQCGLALACIGGTCLPCSSDSQCAVGEACVLDHCAQRELVTCRSRRDCPGQNYCRLTGFSPGPRSNRELGSVCSSPAEDSKPEVAVDRSHEPSPPRGPSHPSTLLENLQKEEP